MQFDFNLNTCAAACGLAAEVSFSRLTAAETGILRPQWVFSRVKILKNIFPFQKFILNLARIIPHRSDANNEPYTKTLKEWILINLPIPYAKTEQTLISPLKS